MSALLVLLFLLSAAGGTLVVLTREPKRQAAALSLHGLVLTLLFLALGAPDVALSQLAVGTVALPAMVLVTIARTEGRERR